MTSRVLIVEDDHLNRMLLCTVLQNCGYTIEEVSDGAHVLAAVRSFRPDLITMDINLPNVSGLNLIKWIKNDAEMRRIPVLAITAYIGRGEDASIKAAGADSLMTKPISIKPFIARVEIMLAAANAPSAQP